MQKWQIFAKDFAKEWVEIFCITNAKSSVWTEPYSQVLAVIELVVSGTQCNWSQDIWKHLKSTKHKRSDTEVMTSSELLTGIFLGNKIYFIIKTGNMISLSS